MGLRSVYLQSLINMLLFIIQKSVNTHILEPQFFWKMNRHIIVLEKNDIMHEHDMLQLQQS